MSVEENRIIIERYYNEAWNAGKLEVLDEIIDPNYVNHNPGIPNIARGPAGLKPIISALRIGFPDLGFEINDMVITEDKVAVRCTMHGTHLGDLFGMPPTGKKVSVNQMQIEYIKDGKIVEHWRQSDDMGMMKQLGA
jgi:steroid delta-isomerase-like uncharacterized protein